MVNNKSNRAKRVSARRSNRDMGARTVFVSHERLFTRAIFATIIYSKGIFGEITFPNFFEIFPQEPGLRPSPAFPALRALRPAWFSSAKASCTSGTWAIRPSCSATRNQVDPPPSSCVRSGFFDLDSGFANC